MFQGAIKVRVGGSYLFRVHGGGDRARELSSPGRRSTVSPVVPAHRFVAVVAAMGLAVVACSSSQSTPSSVTSNASQTATSETTEAAEAIETAVAVTIEEWAVRPATDSIPAGNVTFGVTNAGPRYGHEFLVVKTDLDPAALPIRSNGVLRESEAGIEVVDQIPGIEIEATRELIVTLAAGKYVLLCNIYDDAGSHLSQGMLTTLTVTE
jgi:hypothetical protein